VVTKSGKRKSMGPRLTISAMRPQTPGAISKTPTLPRAIFRQNQFGASAGGPLQLKNTFFFATYEGVRGKSAQASVASVPTAAVRAEISAEEIRFRPFVVRRQDENARRLFPNNAIPVSKLDSIATKYLQQYEPLPNSDAPAVTTSRHSNQATHTPVPHASITSFAIRASFSGGIRLTTNATA